MPRRLFASVLMTLALVGSTHASTAAAPPLFFVCETELFGQLTMAVESFDRFGAAVSQCAQFWNGRPLLGANNVAP